jgi:type II secretory pathway pseudopilin PulG
VTCGSFRGYTLVEILVATALTLLLMAGVVTLFGSVTDSVSRGQAMMELADRLRATQHRLQTDLKYVTARMLPPLDPRDNLGYFEVEEGPGPFRITRQGVQPYNAAFLTDGIDNDGDGSTDEADESLDTTVDDGDDKAMFTARSYGEPFLGRWRNTNGNQTTMQSQVAEIAWFMRGTTLYRRVLLVVPHRALAQNQQAQPFYENFDVSVHQEGGPAAVETRANWGAQRLITNSLGDLTKRENRYGHHPTFPHPASGWGILGLPTLRECSDANWPYPMYSTIPALTGEPYTDQIDYWLTPHVKVGNNAVAVDPETGTRQSHLNGTRIAEDVILTNVLSFDIKVWDPDAPVLVSSDQTLLPGDPGYLRLLQQWASGSGGAVASFGAYVDLFYLRGLGNNASSTLADMRNRARGRVFPFAGPGDPRSGLDAQFGANPTAAVYDTGSTHYNNDGVDQDRDNLLDEGTDGLDNDNVGGVDDPGELETIPPYPFPLRGVQIKIRVYERDSQQIREVTVTQDFLK